MSKLNQEYLKSIIHYNPNDGIFTWLKSNTNAVKSNSIAGTYSKGYILIQINKKVYKSHRLAWLYMTGGFPNGQIDHINHIRNDNRWNNLREVSAIENNQNRSLQTNNKSGISGVHFLTTRNKWVSYIEINGVRKYLGRFFNFFEACCARKSAEKQYGFHINHGVKLNEYY